MLFQNCQSIFQYYVNRRGFYTKLLWNSENIQNIIKNKIYQALIE